MFNISIVVILKNIMYDANNDTFLYVAMFVMSFDVPTMYVNIIPYLKLFLRILLLSMNCISAILRSL